MTNPFVEHCEDRSGLLPPPFPDPHPDAQLRLKALSARVRHDLEIMVYPKDEWVIPRTRPDGEHVYDVVIVGGGQCGLTTAFALRRERVGNVLVLDQAPKGKEGPWVTYSRMWTLRSPKHLTGPDLGIPSLAPRSWFEAVYGEEGWEMLDKWPRHVWQHYLDWYREVLDLPVWNDACVTKFDLDGAQVAVTLADGRRVFARKVVLATGLEGMGGWYVPPIVKSLPKSRWTLCTDDVDSLEWRGQRVALLGAGATGWDRAADLLELGAKAVTIYMRRKHVLSSNPFRYLEKAGYLRHFQSMSDEDKWRWITEVLKFGQPPTQDGVDRCAAFPNFVLHPGATWAAVKDTPNGVEVTGSDGSVETFDHLFIGCGFSIDAHNREELRPFADNILTWEDVLPPEASQKDPWLKTYPYLSSDLRFQEKTPGKTPILKDIFCFNYGTLVSNAHSGASLSGILYGIGPLIHGITYALWVEDEPTHYAATQNWTEIDTDPAVLANRMWKPSVAAGMADADAGASTRKP
ncbi:FAD-dependent oxidoreductase [Komagataeibacter xylinus]|uniref:NAD(P)/FAD-dependent oxidoreductase n=1 Tax=Komagataeibacter xylinus TaxID=28448 RepID=A0A857FN26_KOMXY|nr:NAD(P)/FAD-dependent oxidoreductase [Komagataeibacter xylinus]QHC35606.1 NAD(P)/FAD-dependent oxidoreductase [Komagataeibacter xylinus]